MSDAPRGPIDRTPPIPVQRPRGLLVDILAPIDLADVRPYGDGPLDFSVSDKILGGVTFCPIGCDGLVAQDNRFCGVVSADANTAEDGELMLPDLGGSDGLGPDSEVAPTFSSFAVLTGEEAPASYPAAMLAFRADQRLRNRFSAALAHELLTGAVTGNPSLASEATVVVDALTPVDVALYVIESLFADLDGLAGVIHASPGAFTLLANEWGIEQDDAETDGDPNARPFRTDTGHIVVGDAGHDGSYGPFDGGVQMDTDVGGEWVYLSQSIQGWLGEAGTRGTETATFGRGRNRRRHVAYREAIVAFDPCFVGAVQIEVPTFTQATTSGN